MAGWRQHPEFAQLLRFLPTKDPLGAGAVFAGVAARSKDGNTRLLCWGRLVVGDADGWPSLEEGKFLDGGDAGAAVVVRIAPAELDDTLDGFLQFGVPRPIQSAFGFGVQMPSERDGQHWAWSAEQELGNSSGSPPRVSIRKRSGINVSERLDEHTFDSLDDAARFRQPRPIDGVAEIVRRLELHQFGGDLRNLFKSSPQVDIAAAVPVFVDAARYSKEVDGYRFNVRVGPSIDPSGLTLAVPSLELVSSLSASDWRHDYSEAGHSVRTLVIRSPERAVETAWVLRNGTIRVAEGRIPAKQQSPWSLLPGLSQQAESEEISLPRGNWTFREQDRLGRSGHFGEVFAGKGADGKEVAVKRLKPNTSGGRRELENARRLIDAKPEYLIPVLDAGRDESSARLYVVMAKASRSLDEFVRLSGGVTDSEAIGILRDLLNGIDELGAQVHRDLKPANVLLHDSRWKLGDFGLVRDIEASTSDVTLKEYLSAEYAAPEQWRNERATKKTDIYALGCIAYFILEGRPPFGEGGREGLREQHLNSDPPHPKTPNRFLRTFISEAMRKRSGERPDTTILRGLLDRAVSPKASERPRDNLTDVAASLRSKRLAREAEAARAARAAEDRSIRAEAARASLTRLFESVVATIEFDCAGEATVSTSGVVLGTAVMQLRVLGDDMTGRLPLSGIDISAAAVVDIRWTVGDSQFGRSASLLFCAHGEEPPEWMEVSFRARDNAEQLPFGPAVSTLFGRMDAAIARKPDSEWEIADPLIPIGADDEFIARWRARLIEAATAER